MIKSFRGLLADGAQDTIRLGTNQGLTGYRIVKFQIMSNLPTSGGHKEHVVQIWKVEQDSVPSAAPAPVDFSNGLLLGAAWALSSDSPAYASTQDILFDSEVFNQDIYVTHTDTDGTDSCNYYIELEQVKLDVNEAAVATLKDMRASN
jgi:hypothetical protein